MKEITLKNGLKVMLREATKEDAKDIIEYFNIIGGESDFTSFGKNGYMLSEKSQEDYIENNNKCKNCKMILSIIDDEIAGIATIDSPQKERMVHNGTLGISFRKKYWGIGLGNVSMDCLVNWAKDNGITKKINLLVRDTNERGIKLYEKFGFEVEGILKNDIYVNGVYCNSIYMGLYID